jgi:type IV pilus assembly protein PilE
MNCTESLFNPRPRRRPGRGYTLIELMIVVTILTLLAGIAIPAYQQYNKRANRSQAAQTMLTIQSREELYILDARTYTTALDSTGLNITQDRWTCTAANCSNTFYTITVALAAGPPQTYTITATPIAGNYQVSDGTLTLTNAGVKTRSAGDGKW